MHNNCKGRKTVKIKALLNGFFISWFLHTFNVRRSAKTLNF